MKDARVYYFNKDRNKVEVRIEKVPDDYREERVPFMKEILDIHSNRYKPTLVFISKSEADALYEQMEFANQRKKRRECNITISNTEKLGYVKTAIPVDVVYVLGTGSKWSNKEIMFSLRSVDKYLKNYRNIYIIGEKPSFAKNIIHIPCGDHPFPEFKERNIMNKILTACNMAEVSDTFLFMNDDHFLNKEIDATDFPFYYDGTLAESIAKRGSDDTYMRSLHNTNCMLENNGLPNLKYDVHTPILYNKVCFKNIMGRVSWDIENGYVIKSLYSNLMNVQPIQLHDLKMTSLAHLDKIPDRPVFSIGDSIISNAFEVFMNALFPDKSRYEGTSEGMSL